MGKCCCCNCIFSCVCACILQILCVIVVLLGIILLAIWLIWKPSKIYFHVSDALLTKFDYSESTKKLDYKLELDLEVRNSNDRIGVKYEFIEVSLTYHSKRFATDEKLQTFSQDAKNTTILQKVIKGHSKEIDLGDYYYNDMKNGKVNIFTLFHVGIKLKSGWIKTGQMTLYAACEITVPMKKSSQTFERTNCVLLPWTK